MDVFLHIGLPKTGTTTIQRFLINNKYFLYKKHGVLYPSTPLFNSGHHLLPLSLRPNIAKARGIEDLQIGNVCSLLESEIRETLGQNYLTTLTANTLCHSPTANKAISLLSSLLCLINHPNLLLSAENPASLKFLLKYLFRNL